MHDGRRQERSVATARTLPEPGVGEAVARWEGVFGIDAVVRNAGQPGAPRNLGDDRGRAARTGRCQNAATKLRVDDRDMGEEFTLGELSAGVEQGHAGRCSCPAWRTVEPPWRDDDGVF